MKERLANTPWNVERPLLERREAGTTSKPTTKSNLEEIF
jgi:hypothetical protein